jgi:peptide-methionine (S)-S-oxide reductase
VKSGVDKLAKIGFGGGCHWCTEAVFQSLKGVEKVEQGWIASEGMYSSFSEAVIVHFYPEIIPLEILIEVHLRTHKSTSDHSMREKYRSAIYVFSVAQQNKVDSILKPLQSEFDDALITKTLPYKAFKPSEENFRDYYYKNPEKPFCENFINPKLKLLLSSYNAYTKTEELTHLSK